MSVGDKYFDLAYPNGEVREARAEEDHLQGVVKHLNDVVDAIRDERDRLQAKVERLEADLTATRVSHAKLMRAIKAALGYQHWPIIKGNVVDGVCSLLTARVEALEGALRKIVSMYEDLREFNNASYKDTGKAAEREARRVLGEKEGTKP